MAELTTVIKDSFSKYAGAVLQSRALVDVRDCIKPSARQIFYCLYTDNFVHSKPFKKTLKGIGSAMRMYIHGDSSCEGVIMRAGQPFAFRYPLVEVDGSYGNLMESGNWAAPRYTSSRLADISNYLFKDINKNTIEEWRDNYDDTEKYPAVLSSKGFYNIVNGTSGIGIGASSNLPQFNITDVNNALIKLLWNPDIDFEEIYCAPDFATGAILLNESEVKESLRNGKGKACKLRSVIEYDSSERCLIVKEIPYGVYTNTICGQLEKLVEENIGIDRFNDLTGKEAFIKIYLSKTANPERVIRTLYKETFLQYHYGINMTMLDNGRFPRVFTWKEALQAHINHEKEVYKRSFEFDLNKIKDRLHIVEGILIALARIEEIIETIKSSSSTAAAKIALCNEYNLTEVQAKAILDIKLAKLAHLEAQKYIDEKEKLINEKEHIETILNDENLFKKEIENGFREVMNKYGDARRTRIMDLQSNDEDEPVEEKNLILHLTNKNNIYAYETSTLMVQKRGGRGAKIKMDDNEYVVDTISCSNLNNCLAFSDQGRAYNININEINSNEKYSLNAYFNLNDGENILRIVSNNKSEFEYIVFVTKSGMIKKSELSEYSNRQMKKGVVALKLKEDDTISNIFLMNSESVGILTKRGKFAIINTENINPIGRNAVGVVGIKLAADDCVVAARKISKNTTELVSITSNGMIKRTPIDNFTEINRGGAGKIIQKIKDNDSLASFENINNQKEVAIISNKNIIKVSLDEIPTGGNIGTRAQKLKETEKVIGIITINE